jgi:hypothetical protein
VGYGMNQNGRLEIYEGKDGPDVERSLNWRRYLCRTGGIDILVYLFLLCI